MVIDDVLIDCGVSYNKIKDYLYNIKYLLITHTHSDHLKNKTYLNIIKNFPRIKTFGNYETSQVINLYKIVSDDGRYELGDKTLLTFACMHNVQCTGFVIIKGDINIIYATDTTSLKNAPQLKYDYLFIESNHDKNKIEQARNNKKKYGYDVWRNAMRHLSTQDSKAFYYINRRSKDSKWIEMHKSSRFY